MTYFKITFLAFLAFTVTSCQSKNKEEKKSDIVTIEPVQDLSKYETAYF